MKCSVCSSEINEKYCSKCGQYYKDKRIAMRYYKRYLKTGNKKYEDYSTKRVEQLKEVIHQMKK